MTNTPLEVFTITPGRRYRFRLINSFGSVCPSQITFEGHSLTIIATDGEAVQPVTVDTIISFSGKELLLRSFFKHSSRSTRKGKGGTSSSILGINQYDCASVKYRLDILKLTMFYPLIYRRKIRLRDKRGSTGRRVLDPSSFTGRMWYTSCSTVRYIEICSWSIPTDHHCAHLRFWSSAGCCKYSCQTFSTVTVSIFSSGNSLKKEPRLR